VEVSTNIPEGIDLYFLFIEDSKSPFYISVTKEILSNRFLSKYGKVQYIHSFRDNLGENRDLAMNIANANNYEWIGFIDDDDRYRSDVINELGPVLKDEKSPKVSIINFGMSGNFCKVTPIYKGYPERKNRLRKWDDHNTFGCTPSCASFIRLSDWFKFNIKFGFNPPSEETTPLMLFTYYSQYVYNYGDDLMYRNRGKHSLVNSLGKYSDGFITNNIIRHVRNLKSKAKTVDDLRYLYSIFKYNYGGYLKTHGANPKVVNDDFNALEINHYDLELTDSKLNEYK
jgi:hypothetical protein